MEALPVDILTEILSYLPAKSTGRFRCVSRAWHATLTSASFAHLQLRRANKPGEFKFFFALPKNTPEEEGSYHDDNAAEEESDDDHGEPNNGDDGNSEEESDDHHGDDGTSGEESDDDHGDALEEEPCNDDDRSPEEDDNTSDEDEPSDDDKDTSEVEEPYIYAWQPGGAVKKLTPHNFHLPTPLTKPLHGLVLIRCAASGYHVFNPCTGAALALPDSGKLPEKMIYRPRVLLPSYLYVAYGLGYCSVTSEYKVVRIFSVAFSEYSPVLCEVFVLGTLAYWRPSAQQPHVCVVKEENPGVFLNGRLHFFCQDGGIVAFDVTGETFGSVLPPPIPPEDAPMKMTELDGCLCICHGDIGYRDGSTYHIWILRNYYKEAKWEQLCRVDPMAWTEPEREQLDSYWIAPLCIHRGDNGQEKIMFGTGSCKVFEVEVPNGNKPEVLFDPDETIGGSFEDYEDPSVALFEESLVPVGCTIDEMVMSSPKTKAWFDILKWMPTRSVANLSMVCRSWRAMVKDDKFIRSHVVHANLNKSPRIMMISDSTFGRFIDLEDVIDHGKATQNSTYLVCSQPCHGLNAGTINSWSFVCNPVRGHVENIVLDGVDHETFFAGQTGLGYDSKNKRHVLVLVTYKEKNLATRYYKLECKLRYVYDKECLSIDDPPDRPIADVAPTYVDGKIFWLVEPNLGPVSLNCEIVAFSFETEEFEVLQGPPCSSHDNGHVSILRLHGALCVACSDKSSNVIDIWMMKDVGIWSTEYHIELEEFSPEYSSERTTPLAVNPMDGRILLSTGQSLGYYDCETMTMETLYRDINVQSTFCPIICEESFVSTLWDGSFLRAA